MEIEELSAGTFYPTERNLCAAIDGQLQRHVWSVMYWCDYDGGGELGLW